MPQRGKKGYASLKATCRVAYLEMRFARLDPLTTKTQPGSLTLVNIVTDREFETEKRDDLVQPTGSNSPLLDPQVAREHGVAGWTTPVSSWWTM
jgi:hypothetical protein